MAQKITLGNRLVGEGEPVFIICEGGVTNYGELELAKRQVDAAYNAGADSIKFQVTVTENLISKKVAKRLQKEMGYDWFSRVKYKEFKSWDDVRELARYTRTGGYPFFATAHDTEALDFLDKELDQPFFKIGSGESHNYEFLKNVGGRKKPVIISFGLQTDEEIMKALEALDKAGAKEIIVLHCTTLYPTPYEMVGLPRMAHLKALTGLPVGISDHSVGWHVVLAGVALGACVVEKHLTFGKDDPRSLDNAGALLPEEWPIMVRQIRDLEKARRDVPAEARAQALAKGRDWAGQSLVAARDLKAGEILSRDMIAYKRPAKGGISPTALGSVLGKKIVKPVEEDEQILAEHLE